MFKLRKKGNRGSLTVETLLIMIPFLLAFCTIINLSRFIQTEMIIHHAITQTAKEMSAYSYVLTASGITGRIQGTNEKSAGAKKDINETVSAVKDFSNAFRSGDAGAMNAAGDKVSQKIQAYASNPNEILSGLVSVGKQGFEQYALTSVAGGLATNSIKCQLALMNDDPNEYLEKLGIVGGLDGLDFSKSKWISNEGGSGNIEIVVTFKLKNQLFKQFDFGEHEYALSASTLSW